MSASNEEGRRRRVGIDDGAPVVNQGLRLTKQAGRLIEALREPGVLFPDGCTLGDVVAVAIQELDVAAITDENS